MTGLENGATYRYQVVTNYADGVTKKSNMQLVTLHEQQEHGFRTGDVNHDNMVDVDDVTLLISYVLGAPAGTFCTECGNVNQSGAIDVDDVTLLISIILNQSFQ